MNRGAPVIYTPLLLLKSFWLEDSPSKLRAHPGATTTADFLTSLLTWWFAHANLSPATVIDEKVGW